MACPFGSDRPPAVTASVPIGVPTSSSICGLPFDDVAGEGVVLYLGDDWNQVALEVGAVMDGEDVIVIHARKLREKFRELYEEATQWQR